MARLFVCPLFLLITLLGTALCVDENLGAVDEALDKSALNETGGAGNGTDGEGERPCYTCGVYQLHVPLPFAVKR